MLQCAMTSSLTLALRQFSTGLVLGIVVFCQNASHAQEAVDIVEYFARAQDARGSGLARKSQPVDVRPAKPDEVIVTMIKGEGKETQVLRQNPVTWWSEIAVLKLETNSFLFPLRPFRRDMKVR